MPKLSLPPAERERLQREKRKKWADLEGLIAHNGGWSTGIPGIWPLVFEATLDSPLPEYFRSKGYGISSGGTASRFLPCTEQFRQAGNVTSVSIQHLKPTEVQVWSLDLPR
jgi:hypothetical protein